MSCVISFVKAIKPAETAPIAHKVKAHTRYLFLFDIPCASFFCEHNS